MIPLLVVENKNFIEMLVTVSSTLHVLSRRSLGRNILDSASNVRTKLRNKLQGRSHVCTTADIWSTKHRSYIGTCLGTMNKRRKSRTRKRGDGSYLLLWKPYY